jgi:hypothetical protein
MPALLRHSSALVLGLLSCERDHHEPPPPPTPTPVVHADARSLDAAIACTADRDCPQLPAGSTCAYTCGPSVCQLVAVSAERGAGPCFGIQRDGARSLAIQDDSTFVIACDVNAGLYCDPSSRRCAPAKPRGAACESDFECGDDGRCDDDKQICVQAEPQGADCHTRHCGRGLYCTSGERCAQRLPIGATCVLADECASLACDHGHCVAAQPPFACSVVHPAW